MHHDVRVMDDAAGVAASAAGFVADLVRAVVEEHGVFTMAVSGGRSPWAMFDALATERLPWEAVSIWQVDERIAPAGDPARNLVGLGASIGALPVTVHPMPVERLLDDEPVADPDAAEAACDDYSASLPELFDLIHLGLGPDGHTASLVPDDDVLSVGDRDVAVTSTAYQGHRRMTMTYRALARTGQLLWLVTGRDKRDALTRMLDGDPTCPAALVEAPRSVVITDLDAQPPINWLSSSRS